MLERFTRTLWPEVARFARRIPDFSYVDTILKARPGDCFPGQRYIWREDGRIVATCTVAFVNAEDAWLHGMRVDPACKSRGVATALARHLIHVAARAGRTWVGLSTRHRCGTAPVFRIAEKLGMEQEGIYACDWYGGLPRCLPRPRLERTAGTYDHLVLLGEPLIFCGDRGWYWARLLPERGSWIDRSGVRLNCVPVHLVRHCHTANGRAHVSRTVNLYDRPADFRSLMAGVLSYACGPRGSVVLCYPPDWRTDLRRVARLLVPGLRPGHTFSPWLLRIYGRRLVPADGEQTADSPPTAS
jgi:GNAT superfamily N-acetyltransferase